MNKDIQRAELQRNCFDVAPQALLLAAGVVLSVVLISIMIARFKDAQKLSDVAGNQLVSKTQEILENEIMQYDGLTCKGADVVNFYKKHLGEFQAGESGLFSIEIKWAGGSYTYSDGSYIDRLRDSESSHYIKPGSQFKCKIVKNKNGIITQVIFTKI